MLPREKLLNWNLQFYQKLSKMNIIFILFCWPKTWILAKSLMKILKAESDRYETWNKKKHKKFYMQPKCDCTWKKAASRSNQKLQTKLDFAHILQVFFMTKFLLEFWRTSPNNNNHHHCTEELKKKKKFK